MFEDFEIIRRSNQQQEIAMSCGQKLANKTGNPVYMFVNINTGFIFQGKEGHHLGPGAVDIEFVCRLDPNIYGNHNSLNWI